MNGFIKLICVSVLITAPAHAMDHKRSYPEEIWPKIDCLTQEDLAMLKKARAENPKENFGELLIAAAKAGNLQGVNELLWRGTPAHYQSPQDSQTALMNAVSNRQLACAQTLIEARADIHQKDPLSRTLLDGASLNSDHKTEAFTKVSLTQQLIEAAQKNKFILIKQLISNGAHAYGNEALIESVKLGHILCVKDLIAAKAQIDLADSQGNTALMYAASNGSYLCTLDLIEAKADIHQKNNLGKTALDFARTNGHLKIIEPLIKKSFKNQMKDNLMNNPPSHLRSLPAVARPALRSFNQIRGFAMIGWGEKCIKILSLSILVSIPAHAMQDDAKLGKWLIEATKENEHAEVLDLINQGAPVDYADAYGTTALMYAAGHGHMDCVEALLVAKANTNEQTHAGNTALMQAIISDNIQCVHALIHAKALINQSDKTGTTPLMIAASTGKLSCLEALLAAGAQIDQRDNNSNTALMQATKNGHEQCVQALTAAKDLSEQLLVAAQKGNDQEVIRLIAHGAEVDYRNEDQNGCTALIYAAYAHNLPCIQALITAKAEVNAQDHANCTPLIYLSFSADMDEMPSYRTSGSQLECMKTLIKAKADINLEDADGYNVLNNILDAQDLPCIQLLLATGVKKSDINFALIESADQGYFDGVKALIEAKADLYYSDKFLGHRTALALAANNHDQPMCELLIEAMLRKPTEKQKAQMCLFLSCLKYKLCYLLHKPAGLGELHRNRTVFFRTALAQEVYLKNKKNFAQSDVYSEVAKLPEGAIKQTLLIKYNDNTGAISSPETKRAKTE